MPGEKQISERERAAVEWCIMSGNINKVAAYRIAYPGSTAEVEGLRGIASTAAHWWQSIKISEYRNEFATLWKARREKERKAIEDATVAKVRDSDRKESGGGAEFGGLVDYSDPANQRRKLNELINTADDAGEILDALKVMISGQKDGQAAKERKQVLAYLPLQCSECFIRAFFEMLPADVIDELRAKFDG